MNLSLCPICGKLSEEEQTALFSSLDYSTRSFKKGDWVARQGDALSSLYLLSKGRVKTEMITESGTILEVETYRRLLLWPPHFCLRKIIASR